MSDRIKLQLCCFPNKSWNFKAPTCWRTLEQWDAKLKTPTGREPQTVFGVTNGEHANLLWLSRLKTTWIYIYMYLYICMNKAPKSALKPRQSYLCRQKKVLFESKKRFAALPIWVTKSGCLSAGPRESVPRKLECMQWVMHLPPEHFRPLAAPYRTLPDPTEGGFVWVRRHHLGWPIRVRALQKQSVGSNK